jgi:hypothetical protein
MPHQTLDITDAAELAELLQFLRDWLTNDHDQLAESLTRFVGNHRYDLDQLCQDLDRLTFLLVGNNSEGLFHPNLG